MRHKFLQKCTFMNYYYTPPPAQCTPASKGPTILIHKHFKISSSKICFISVKTTLPLPEFRPQFLFLFSPLHRCTLCLFKHILQTHYNLRRTYSMSDLHNLSQLKVYTTIIHLKCHNVKII